MRYRKLDANGDYVIGKRSGQFYVDEKAAVAQAIGTRLKLWAGEWFLDVKEGTPYYERILGHGTQGTRDFAIRQRILETPGVQEIVSYSSGLDAERKLTVNATVKTIYGNLTISTPL